MCIRTTKTTYGAIDNLNDSPNYHNNLAQFIPNFVICTDVITFLDAPLTILPPCFLNQFNVKNLCFKSVTPYTITIFQLRANKSRVHCL